MDIDVKVEITPDEISKVISSTIKSMAKAEAKKFIKQFYVEDNQLIIEEVRKIVYEIVTESTRSPEFLEHLKKIANEVARTKAASFIRNNQNEFIK